MTDASLFTLQSAFVIRAPGQVPALVCSARESPSLHAGASLLSPKESSLHVVGCA